MNNEKLELIKATAGEYIPLVLYYPCAAELFVIRDSMRALDKCKAVINAYKSCKKFLDKLKHGTVTNNWLRMHGFRPRRKPR